MKYVYIVVDSDADEPTKAYMTRKAAKKVADEMNEEYGCSGMSEDVEVRRIRVIEE